MTEDCLVFISPGKSAGPRALHGYWLKPDYTHLKVYSFEPETRELGHETGYFPFQNLSRKKKWEVVCRKLRAFNLPEPKFKP